MMDLLSPWGWWPPLITGSMLLFQYYTNTWNLNSGGYGKDITPVTALVNCVNAGLIHIQEV
jgi:hypothetical protein